MNVRGSRWGREGQDIGRQERAGWEAREGGLGRGGAGDAAGDRAGAEEEREARRGERKERRKGRKGRNRRGAGGAALVVVADDADELREVPAVPLLDAHREGVDVLVQRVQEGDALDDHVVLPERCAGMSSRIVGWEAEGVLSGERARSPVHVELDLGAGVRVCKAELRTAQVPIFEPLDVACCARGNSVR